MKPAPMIEWLEEFTTDGDRVDVKAVVEAKKGFVLSGSLFLVNVFKKDDKTKTEFFAMPIDRDEEYCSTVEMCDVDMFFMETAEIKEFIDSYLKFLIEGGKFENKDFT